MSLHVTTTVSAEQWQALTEQASSPHINQTWAWGELYAARPGVSTIRFLALRDNQPVGGLQAHLWRWGGVPMALLSGDNGAGGGPIISRGVPDTDRQAVQQQLLEAFFQYSQQHYVAQATVYTSPLELCQVQLPGIKRAEQWTPIAPLNTTAEQMLSERVAQKTRNQINKGQRNGVTATRGTRDDLAAYYDMQMELAQRKSLPLRHVNRLSDLQALWDALEPQHMVQLWLARHEERTVGGVLLLSHGGHVLYRSGVQTEVGRTLYAGNVLQWAAIAEAIDAGATVYNLCGGTTDEHDPLYGITKFKCSFGADLQPFARYSVCQHRLLRFVAYRLRRLSGHNEWFPLIVYP